MLLLMLQRPCSVSMRGRCARACTCRKDKYNECCGMLFPQHLSDKTLQMQNMFGNRSNAHPHLTLIDASLNVNAMFDFELQIAVN